MARRPPRWTDESALAKCALLGASAPVLFINGVSSPFPLIRGGEVVSIVPYDDASVEQIATTLNLRLPNKNALDALARALDGQQPGTAMVADLATGVGKTYIAGGLLDYLYEQGVRNVVIVTPGSTIQRKTIDNLTPGNPKYLTGLQSNPLVITLDDFERGTVGAALDDPNRFKVFVFTVQSLLRPNTSSNRRAHTPHETLGQSLSDYLEQADDLVVIADEHHVYFTKTARQFERAIKELDPIALIGLTATPHESTDPASIVFHYPLADAIADGYVKIPVLVARPDKRSDVRTQMADGVALLAAKEAAMTAYVKATGHDYVQPVLFVVAQTIDEANEIRTLLAGPDFLDGDENVLLVTSEEPDATLTALDTLDQPGSRIKAVVSVSMLKEGWDCKSIYVIAAVRALESNLLTEQILGRGLRLPFGRRTGVGMLDTVEVLSHHAFADLLKQAKVLLSQTLGDRADEVTVTTSTVDGVRGDEVVITDPAHTPEVPMSANENASVSVTLPGTAAAEVEDPNQPSLFGDTETEDDPNASHEVVGLSTVGSRIADGEKAAETLATPVLPRELNDTHLPLFLPRVSYKWDRDPFSLTSINTVDVEALGASFANDNAPSLTRKVIDAERDETGQVDLHIQDAVDDTVVAATLPIPFDNIENDLIARVMRSNAVASSVTEMNAATEIARAFLRGARVTEQTPWRVEHGRLATEALTGWISGKQTATPGRLVPEVTQTKWPEPPERTEAKPPADRQLITSGKDFERAYPYKGWSKSFYPVVSFDSYTAEFKLAETLDTSPSVAAWQRITSTVPIAIPYKIGATQHTYMPDFIVIDSDGVRWVVEAKADSEMSAPVVLAKRDAAHQWVNAVNTAPNIPTRWAYLLASESVIKNAGSWNELKTAAQTHR